MKMMMTKMTTKTDTDDCVVIRQPDDLLNSALNVIDVALWLSGATRLFPLLSGGHDSLTVCYIASLHESFDGRVHHIDTGIGAKATRRFVEETCNDYGWDLVVHKSNFSYEKFVTRLGFPGPGSHQWIYNKLKDRCISTMSKKCGPVVLVTGCRQQESTRRMGHVEPIQQGEVSRKTGVVRRSHRIWTAPAFDWSAMEQKSFMDFNDLPRNPIKQSPLGMSGECFCGAFARPNEIALIRCYAPDVAEEIDRLTKIVACCDVGSKVWGNTKRKGIVVAQTGPLCSSCDVRAHAAGLMFEDMRV